MILLHRRRPAEAPRSRSGSYDQVRTAAPGRPQMGALGLGDDRGRAIGCGDLAGVTARPRGGQMRQRPAASTPCVTPAGARRRQVTIGTVRAAEQAAAPVVDGTAALAGHLAAIKQALDGPDAHLWRMALMPCAARIAELTSELRRLVSGVSL